MGRNPNIKCIPIRVNLEFCLECHKTTPYVGGYCFYCHSAAPLGDPYDCDLPANQLDDYLLNNSILLGDINELNKNDCVIIKAL